MGIFNTMGPRFQAAVRDPGVRIITLGWTGFIAENIVMSHYREFLYEEIGSKDYHTLYNTLSAVACGSILFGYFRRGRQRGPTVANFNANTWPRFCRSFAFSSLGLVGFSQWFSELQFPYTLHFGADDAASTNPATSLSESTNTPLASPSSDIATSVAAPAAADTTTTITSTAITPAVSIKSRCPFVHAHDEDGVFSGTERITRHPMLWSLGFLGIGAALSTPFITERVLCVFPLIFAYIGGSHQDHRFRQGNGGSLTPEQEAITSNVPFVALMMGKQNWGDLWSEVKTLNAVLALVLAATISRAGWGVLPFIDFLVGAGLRQRTIANPEVLRRGL